MTAAPASTAVDAQPADTSDPVGMDSSGALPDELLLKLLWTEADRLRRGVVDEIATRGERLIPRLADLIHDDDAWAHYEAPECWAVVHATLALAATGSMDAVAPLLEAIRRAHAEDVDWITDAAGELFNRVGPDCFWQVRAVYRAHDEDPYVRWACLNVMSSLSLQREDLQQVVIRDAALALEDKLGWELEDAAHYVLADYFALGRTEAVLEALGADPEEPPQWLQRPEGHGPFRCARRDPLSFYDPTAVAARQERWKQEEAEAADEAEWLDDDEWREEDDGSEEGHLDDWLPHTTTDGLPFVRAEPKIGRNEPCPCGSGRKHKGCCLR